MGTDGVIIAGPTASGKTALAVGLAKALDGVVINADSMQVYTDLQHLSARPTVDEMASVPHYLFGHVAPNTRYSVGCWLQDVEEALAAHQGRHVIFCGGTGLYLRALQHGLVDTPNIPAAIKQQVAETFEVMTLESFIAHTKQYDVEAFAHVQMFDPQRVLRAAEVVFATGQSLSAWQGVKSAPPLCPNPYRLVLLPAREDLYAKINQRCAEMFRDARDEVSALLAQNLGNDLPIMRCIGIPEFRALAAGEMDAEAALQKFAQATRHYAKRQYTWLRHQMTDKHVLTHFGNQISAATITEIVTAIRVAQRAGD